MYWLLTMPSELNLQLYCTFPIIFSDSPPFYRRERKKLERKEDMCTSKYTHSHSALGGLACLTAIGES